MITIIYSTHKDEVYNKNFYDHLTKTVGVKDPQILQYQNNNEFSLAEVYNKGIMDSIYDIVVCLHNDVKLEQNWGKKLLQDFNNNPDYGIIGKAGTTFFPESGIYWEKLAQTMVGQVYHYPPGQKKFLSKYSAKLPFLIPVVSLDGLFLSFDKTKIKHKFDETIGRFHFYDHPFCLSNYLDRVKIGVTSSFEITHQSVGKPNEEFFSSKEIFLNKFKKHLPLDLKPEKIYIEQIKEKPLKNIGKVAVIIPTKGKIEMLHDCVKSFYDHCNSELFTIFIADTGSTDDEKNWVKENVLTLGDVRLIEYDYYNFAKINNDVVKNHISDDYTFLLFSNNDIKLLNNVIYNMLSVFKQNNNVGTVGARLYFADNTVQHDGILIGLEKTNNIRVTHHGFGSYYGYTTHTKNVIGNTAGFMMIRKKIFEKCNMFNENYIECFEDVELNLKCEILGYKNFISGKSVAYHYESQSRNNDKEKNKKTLSDFKERLEPFIKENLKKLKSIVIIN